MNGISFIDSHTAGEPTRLVLAGGPDLGDGPLAERLALLKSRHDDFRRTVILEPRGSEALVGALLCEPHAPECAAGVIFFNNTGYLGMCGHGAIGLVASLRYRGTLPVGLWRIDTPVGVVEGEVQTDHRVAIHNVPAYRYRTQVVVEVPQVGRLVGDIAYGGNWFFLAEQSPLPLVAGKIPELTDAARRTLRALRDQGITGADGAEIDHVEFFAPPEGGDANSRNFVLCPGGAYDRSPCGTGTSAKLACLASDGLLPPGEDWVQEGILGSRFVGRYKQLEGDRIAPVIVGEAYVTAVGELVRQPEDPFRQGILVGDGV